MEISKSTHLGRLIRKMCFFVSGKRHPILRERQFVTFALASGLKDSVTIPP